jgi:acetyl-CoA carboxylase carboxyltransferase component
MEGSDRREELARRRQEALAMGGADRLAKLAEAGRLNARERIGLLVDEGSFFEVGLLAEPERRLERPVPGDGVVTGYGRIDDRPVGVIALDPTVLAGTTAPISMRKQGRIAETCGEKGFPLVVLADADGGRIPDVVGWRFSHLPFDFDRFLQSAPGRPDIPRITIALGPSYGDAGLHAASADIVIMTEQAAVALAGPPVIAEAIGEVISDTELGGPAAAVTAGNAHIVSASESEAISQVNAVLSFFPQNAAEPAPRWSTIPPARDPAAVAALVPSEPRRTYDMRPVLETILDGQSTLYLGNQRGPGVVTALSRLDGWSVGVIASQPAERNGVLDPPALAKCTEFIDLCDRFNLPLLLFQDVPGLMVGVEAESGGVLRGYERMAARLARARVPKLGVVMRKAYGGGHFALGGRPTKPDFLFAWPSAEIGFMAPAPGVRTVYRRKIDAMGPEAAARFQEEQIAQWQDDSAPWEAAAHLALDDIIDPSTTRDTLIAALGYAWPSGPRVTEAGQ